MASPQERHQSEADPEQREVNKATVETSIEEADISVTELPNGDRMYNARFVNENGEQHVVAATVSREGAEGGKEHISIVIDGERISDVETTEKVIELLGIHRNDGLDVASVEADYESSVGSEAGNVAMEIREQVTRELHKNNPGAGVHADIVQRRTGELVGDSPLESNGEGGEQDMIDVIRAKQTETGRAVLAEEIIDKDQKTADALADALRVAGDGSGAKRLEQLAYDATYNVGGVRQLDNADARLQQFGKEAERAMKLTGTTVEELEDKAEQSETA